MVATADSGRDAGSVSGGDGVALNDHQWIPKLAPAACGVSDLRTAVGRSEPMIPFGASWVLDVELLNPSVHSPRRTARH